MPHSVNSPPPVSMLASSPTDSNFSASGSSQWTSSLRPSDSLTSPSSRSGHGEDFNSCHYHAPDLFDKLQHDIEVSDEPPTAETLRRAGEINVFNASSHPVPFKSLYSGDEIMNPRQLFIFIRFFYCCACQAYIRALTESITSEVYFTMPIPTSIIIIGCGQPDLIAKYKKRTGCPWPIYADPSRKLYKTFGMSWTLNLGTKPEYVNGMGMLKQNVLQTKQMLKAGRHGFRGGPILQIGGEFLMEDGKVIWCHRMRNVRDHAEVRVIRRVLDLDWETAEPEQARGTEKSSNSVEAPNTKNTPHTDDRATTPTAPYRGLDTLTAKYDLRPPQVPENGEPAVSHLGRFRIERSSLDSAFAKRLQKPTSVRYLHRINAEMKASDRDSYASVDSVATSVPTIAEEEYEPYTGPRYLELSGIPTTPIQSRWSATTTGSMYRVSQEARHSTASYTSRYSTEPSRLSSILIEPGRNQGT